MPFRNRSNRLRPINSLKHIIDFQGAVTGGLPNDTIIINAVENASSATANEVDIGARVNGFFLNVQCKASAEVALSNIYMIIYKNPGGNFPNSAIPAVNEVGTSDFRKFVFHQEMAMLSDTNDSIPTTLFKGVLPIPRHMQRMGVNDIISVRVGTPTAATGNDVEFCIECIYKEYR